MVFFGGGLAAVALAWSGVAACDAFQSLDSVDAPSSDAGGARSAGPGPRCRLSCDRADASFCWSFDRDPVPYEPFAPGFTDRVVTFGIESSDAPDAWVVRYDDLRCAYA